ncbi:hypothetical protein CN378_03290 [Bacillus sp. AFS015802]|uniref:M23 family metallopeptidase n=1 Tax=Bacillus sp. AFS015802 TaxID=2033486 RepID=UPI000BF8170A|nr:M23 family metallopeptidase [Bacillus sp. AFS015802]PFA69806.1 hypothetical protein CN378_03290 [Bacillus sp. AFS015802]
MKMKKFLSVAAIIGLSGSLISGGVSAAETGPQKADPLNPYDDFNWRYFTTSNYITSEYLDPTRSSHLGVDVDTGYDPAYAVSSGRVKYSGVSSSAGNWIVLETNNNSPESGNSNDLIARYLHLDERWVSTGATVSRGQQIGITGTTGNSTGTHIHFDVNDGGVMNGSDMTRYNTIDPEIFWPYKSFIYGDSPYFIQADTEESLHQDEHAKHLKYFNEETSFADYVIDYVGEDNFWDWFNGLTIEERTMKQFKKDFKLNNKKIETIKEKFVQKNKNN